MFMFPLKNLACKGGNYGLKNGGEVGPWAHVLLITTVVIIIDYTTKTYFPGAPFTNRN